MKVSTLTSLLIGSLFFVSAVQAGGGLTQENDVPPLLVPGPSDKVPGPALPDKPEGTNPALDPNAGGSGNPFSPTMVPGVVNPDVFSYCALHPTTPVQVHINGEKVYILMRTPGC